MALVRFTASLNNTITNAYKGGLLIRATGSNSGKSDVLETFSIYARQSTSSAELSRILVQFDTNQISSSRDTGDLPASGSVSFYLNLFNAETSKTVPRDFKLVVKAVSSSWEEGMGTDIELDTRAHSDKSNWVSASRTTSWVSEGGDYHTSPVFSQSFNTGLENLEVDVTSLVEEWIAGTKTNYGFGIFLSSSYEASSSGNPSGATSSYYTKRFFSRGTEYFFKKPTIEARWDSSRKDDRGNFYLSSALAPASDNLNTLYLYNFVRGRLRNIPDIGTGSIYVDLYETLGGDALTQAVATPATGGYVSTGIYSCSVCLSGTYTTLRDVWYSGSTQYHTGTITVNSFSAQTNGDSDIFVNQIKNLKPLYNTSEVPRMYVFTRPRNWSPTIYTVANSTVETTIINSASYRVYRSIDGYEAIPYGTGSDLETLMSYDKKGNYFDLKMDLLQPGYEYVIKLAFYDDETNTWKEQKERFKFRLAEDEY